MLAFLLTLTQIPAGPGDYPQFRGPQREGISADTGLLKEWPKEGPPLLWRVAYAGVGYSSVSVKDGRIFTQGDLDGVEHVICLSAEDGRVLWAVQPEPAARRLTERVKKDMERADTDKNGTLEELEYLAAFSWEFNRADRAGDGDPAAIATGRAARLMAAFDKNADGKLEQPEASRFGGEFFRIDAKDAKADAAALAKERAARHLGKLDADKDGKITREEAKGSELDPRFGNIDRKEEGAEADKRLTAEEMERYFAKEEAGKDGFVTEAELAESLRRNFPGRDGVLTAAELRGHFGGLRDGMGDGPRGTPTVDGDRVYAEGGTGDVTCLEAATGKMLWHVSLVDDLGGGRPGWGYSESPLIEGDWVIVTPGGKNGTVAALDKKTGKVVWRSTGVTQGAQYSSPVAADLNGVRQIVQFATKSMFGLSAKSGELLWEYGKANNGTANCSTPVIYKDLALASSAYGTGGGAARIGADGAKEVYFEKKLADHHGGIIRLGSHLYSIGAGSLLCMEFESGKIAWQDRSVGKGSLCLADGMLYLLSENHTVGLAEATPEGHRERGRFTIPDRGRPSWAHPVVTGGRFYIRDQAFLTAYDVRAR